MRVNFVLIGEGTSDLRLVEHIESVLIQSGFDEVSGEAPDLGILAPNAGRTVSAKLAAVLQHYPNIDAIFVHRDADRAGIRARENEILNACNGITDPLRVVPVIPVTMLETWLLADQQAIKEVAGNSNFRGDIPGLPKSVRLEQCADTKQLLLDALCIVSGAEGGRLIKFKKRFTEMRARLTFDLDPDGPVNELPSYQNFRNSINLFCQRMIV